MRSDTSNVYYILPAGGGEEVPVSWEELEELVRKGELTMESRVFFPKDSLWRRVSETELAALVAESRGGVDIDAEQAPLREEYESAAERAKASDNVTDLIQAGELAAKLGDLERARLHFQEALEQSPYHPRAVSSTKRSLPPPHWKNMRYLQRPKSAWNDPLSIFLYPLAGGPIYLAVVAAAIVALFWIPFAAPIGVAALYLWLSLIIRSAGDMEPRPPLWHEALASPFECLVRPFLTGLTTAVALYGPVLLIASIAVATGASDRPDGLTLLSRSPILLVILGIVSVVVWPIVLVAGSLPGVTFARTVDPRRNASAITRMEGEYVLAVGFVALVVAVWGMIAGLIGWVPILGRLVTAAAAAYLLPTVGLVLGRLQARFRDDLHKASSH